MPTAASAPAFFATFAEFFASFAVKILTLP